MWTEPSGLCSETYSFKLLQFKTNIYRVNTKRKIQTLNTSCDLNAAVMENELWNKYHTVSKFTVMCCRVTPEQVHLEKHSQVKITYLIWWFLTACLNFHFLSWGGEKSMLNLRRVTSKRVCHLHRAAVRPHQSSLNWFQQLWRMEFFSV